MGDLEAFTAAGVTGVAGLLAFVAALASRRAEGPKMAVLCAAFASAAAGGAYMLAGEVMDGQVRASAPTAFALAMLACLVLLYAALFARRA